MSGSRYLVARRAALRLGLTATLAPALGPAAKVAPGWLDEATLADLQRLMANGRLSSVELTGWYLSRIEGADRRGPRLCSVLEVDPDALRQAEVLDEERRRGWLRHPLLHGIPVLLKDVVETADRTHTTAGSLALLGARARQDATAAARLRQAGAVLLGKANLTVWAGSVTTRVNGWSPRGGQCRNPYKLDRSPGGSSSGSAVAVAANLCAVAIGVETNGSILCPAAVNGVVGLKPTVGLTSRAGVIPSSPTQDSVGVLARTVADAAAVLGVLAGTDPRDPATAAARGGIAADYTRFLDPRGLAGARIGVPRRVYFGYSEHADAAAERAIRVLRSGGATVVDPADIPTAEEMAAAQAPGIVSLYETKHSFETYLRDTPGEHPRDLPELIEFTRQHADTELKYFSQRPLELVEAFSDGDLRAPRYVRALAETREMARNRGLDAVFAQHRLDALLMPSWTPAWKTDFLNGDVYLGGSSTPSALAGYPAVSVPSGDALGLPLGITLTGPAWSEPVLIRLAFAYEQAARARRTPGFAGPDVGL
ncbi:amidase [Amycolatopsis sp. NPDC004079]|uniref:amidase n=1 Tax=Amycolatopsis sp. NPDC004079 TaxID=3154549 RepID=UPI0033A37713